MQNINFIRENPEKFNLAMKKRGLDITADEIVVKDKLLREHITELEKLQKSRNDTAKNIGMAKRDGQNTDELEQQAKEINQQLAQYQKDIDEKLRPALDDLLISLPNILSDETPEGKDEADNQIHSSWGQPAEFSFPAQAHFDLGESLGMMDFETAANISGARFVLLKSDLARLERALAQFMLDEHTQQHGYQEISPPILVKDEALFGTGQLPKFSEDLFKTTDDRWLIPTGEVPLTNIVREKILEEKELPLRFCALTPCFRSEAGSAGRDTRGMIRLHQFNKVELVSIVTPEEQNNELARMLSASENILKKLELPYRVMTLCSGDTGFSSELTYDIEVWLPAQKQYREISSCSKCGDFQARRMKARYRPLPKEGEKPNKIKPKFVNTLNGSGVAVGRALVAVMENYQQNDGSIAIPKVLQNYMGDQEIISNVS